MEGLTPSYQYEFVVWGIPKLMAAITDARAALTPAQIETLRAVAQNQPEKGGDGLKILPPLMDLFSR